MRIYGKKPLLLGVLIILCIGALAYRKQLGSIMTVLAIAGGFTLVLSPLCDRLERLGLRPRHAAAVSAAMLALISVSVIGVILPYIAAQILSLVKNDHSMLSMYLEQSSAWIERTGLGALKLGQVLDDLSVRIADFMMYIVRAGGSLVISISKCALAAVMAYYLLCERVRYGRHLCLFIPLPYRMPLLYALSGCRNAALGYLSGMAKTSLFIFVLTYTGLLLLRIPDALFLSVLLALLEALPYVGPILASIPILLSAASAGLGKMLASLVLVVVVQMIEGNFAGPHFAASSTSLHPFAALTGVFVFGTLFGFWGILLAIPALVMMQSITWSIIQTKSVLQRDWI